MNSIDFNELELTPLDESDVQHIEGGIWKELALIAIAGVVADWSDFKKGLAAGLGAN